MRNLTETFNELLDAVRTLRLSGSADATVKLSTMLSPAERSLRFTV